MRLELWHEKSVSSVKRLSSLNAPLFLAQLHYVKLCLSSCGQEEPRCLCEFRNKKINLFNRRVFVCVLRKYARGARTYPNSRISD